MTCPWHVFSTNSLPSIGKTVYLLIEEDKPQVKEATLERCPTGDSLYQWRFTKGKKVRDHDPQVMKAWRYVKPSGVLR